mmetsp:Transcript_155949/g.275568  ORF Transcript_155949/g.275568 Transcript_155949/m.275568 type:complete len:3044 (-) Transcript_155949:238-9369(-)
MERERAHFLHDALEKLKSEQTHTANSGLDLVRQWLEENRGTEPDIEQYVAAVRYLMAFMRRQVNALAKSGASKRPVFRTDAGIVLLEAIKGACRMSRRTGRRLEKLQGRIWEHVMEVVNSDPVMVKKPEVLSYYCWVVKELASCPSSACLSELRDDQLHKLLQSLLKIPANEGKNSALDAVTQLVRRVDGDISAEAPWLCDHLVGVLKSGGQRNGNAAGCLAAVALRCPFAFRDWLFTEGSMDKFASSLTSVSWRSKAADGLDVVLRLALCQRVPLRREHASSLLLEVLDALDASVRNEDLSLMSVQADSPGSSAARSLRVGRLADLSALLVVQGEGSPAAAALYLSGKIEQRLLPCSLCVVRLCERYGTLLATAAELANVFIALVQQHSENCRKRLGTNDLTAVYRALSAVITLKGWVCAWPFGTPLPNKPLYLTSLSGEGATTAPLAAPAIVHELPAVNITAGGEGQAWATHLDTLWEQVTAILAAGNLPRGLHELLATLLLVLPADHAAANTAARQFLDLQRVHRPSASTNISDPPVHCCVLAALRRYRPDVKAQVELLRDMEAEAIEFRIAFLRLMALKLPVTTPAAHALDDGRKILGCVEDIDHTLDTCAVVASDENHVELVCRSSRARGSAPGSEKAAVARWYETRRADVLRQFEVNTMISALDSKAAETVTGIETPTGVGEDLFLTFVEEAFAFSQPRAESQLHYADAVSASPHRGAARIPESPLSAAACEATFKSLEWHLEEVMRATDDRAREPIELVSSVTQVLLAMSVALRLSESSRYRACAKHLSQCLPRILTLTGNLLLCGTKAVALAFEALVEFLGAAEELCNGGSKEVQFLFASKEVAEGFASLADAACARLKQSTGAGAKVQTDAFGGQMSMMTARRQDDESLGLLRSCSLRLLVVLSCLRSVCAGSSGREARRIMLERLQQALVEVTRDAAVAVASLRLVTMELSRRVCPANVADIVADALCAAPDPVMAHGFEDFFLCALRLTIGASQASDALKAVLQHLWVTPTQSGEPRLVGLTRRFRNDESRILRPRGRLIYSVLLTRTLPLLQRTQGTQHALEAVSDACSSIVPEFILSDSSSEVRLTVGATCTKHIFDMYDPEQVFPEFEGAFKPLAGAADVKTLCLSTHVASVQAMLQVAQVQGFMGRILSLLCTFRPSLRDTVRIALQNLDLTCFGRLGSKLGASFLALTFRTQIFEAWLRVGQPLAKFPLAEVSMESPPNSRLKGLAWHLPAAVAAMVLAEETKQLPDLGQACGFTNSNLAEFFTLIFAPLAGTLLPIKPSLEPLRQMYGAEKLKDLCRKEAHRILAFSFQLPFLTRGSQRPIEADAIRVAFEELDPQAPWANFKGFVSQHFRFLLAHLDCTLQASLTWAPAVATSLWRSFVVWVGALSGSRLRLLLPTLVRHGLRLPASEQIELNKVIELAVTSSSKDALFRLVQHQDESLRELLASVEHEWAESDTHRNATPGSSNSVTETSQEKHCPALAALVAVLHPFTFSSPGTRAQKIPAGPAEWLFLQVEAMMPRLSAGAQKVIVHGTDCFFQAADCNGSVSSSGPPAKRRRILDGAVDGFGTSLERLDPPVPQLAWGPLPVPDLGTVAHCLWIKEGKDKEAAEPGCSDSSSGAALTRALQLLSQPILQKQVQGDEKLARIVAQGLSAMEFSDTAWLGTQLEGGALEGALYNAVSPGCGQKSVRPPSEDQLLCCGALLGVTFLQVHTSARVRMLALEALEELTQLTGLKSIVGESRDVLRKILDKQHLCLEDLDDALQVSAANPSRDQSRRLSRSTSRAGVASWDCFQNSAGPGCNFSEWVRQTCVLMLTTGAREWQSPASEIADACVILAKHVDWFAERMLVLATLKLASNHQFAEQLTAFFRGEPEATRAHCVIRALHFFRLFQTCKLGRAVPLFPKDASDPLWSTIDLCAVANCACRVGWARDSLLYLELHLARSNPQLPISETLLPAAGGPGARPGIDELFHTPGPEVQLIHSLAEQLPDDELLYGVPQWCHATSRLARAKLGQDHLATLHLQSDLRKAALEAQGPGGGDSGGLDDALARLGLHAVIADAASPGDGASSAMWERRMESLWRLQQWGPVSGSDGFHTRMHSALSSLSHISQPGAMTDIAAAALERPLSGLVAQVTAGLHAGSPEHLRQGAVQLQMLGSMFDVVEATAQDARAMTTSASNAVGSSAVSMSSLGTRWSQVDASSAGQHFSLLEPLHALRGTLLTLTAPPLTVLRFRTAMATQARSAAQTHRALGLLEEAQRLASGAPRVDVLRLRWEQARCFWELHDQQQAISIARAVAGECQREKRRDLPAAERTWMARVLSDTGLWLSLSRLEEPDVICRDYFDRAVTLNPSDAQPRRQLAEILDARLSEELARQSSFESSVARNLARSTMTEHTALQKDIEALERNSRGRENELRQMRASLQNLNKQMHDDQRREQGEREKVKTLALNCIQHLGRCLAEASDQNLTKVACRFVSLWFDYSHLPEITAAVKEAIQKCSALVPLAPFFYQLASRLGTQDRDFQKTLEELLEQIVAQSVHALWPLLLIKNGGEIPKDMRGADRFVPDNKKIDAAKRVLERLRRNGAVKASLEAVEVLSKFYLDIAFFAVDKKNREAEIRLNAMKHYQQAKRVMGTVPVPTASPPAPGGPPVPCIKNFVESILIAKQGLSAPKIVRLYDTTGVEHQQMVKGMDDLRQDAVMQQLFRLLNDVFAESPRARQAGVRLRTFQVVPLSPCAGIMEFVTGTATIGELLTGNNNPQQGAHHRYRPEDWTHNQCRKRMQEAREAAAQGPPGSERAVLETAFAETSSHFRPVMHLVFLEYFPSPVDWHRARQDYARSAAVSSMVGYVVGIGDRHTNNILFDQKTGELVHIDFGIAFDAGRGLRVPELVPFRLSGDIVDGLGCLGTCGLFRRCCVTTMEVLRDSSALVSAIVEVFVHDPVYFWTLAQTRRGPQAARGENGAVGAGPGTDAAAAEGNEMAKRALLVVKQKLHGQHDAAATLGVHAQVGSVIREAMDPSNLARMYFGWSPWV